jgi:putative Holliday junction resolvase
MAFLGIDYGTRRIGLAVSDAEGRIAFPAGALARKSRAQDLDAIAKLAAERGVRTVVVGLPVHMNGRRGPEAAAALRFAGELAARLGSGVAVETLDERLTTREAERTLDALGRSARRREKGEVDALAATLLLRTFLERRARGARLPA